MGKREVEYLGRRAFDFLETTRDDVEKGRFDLAAFHAEQTLQLALKYFWRATTDTIPIRTT